LQLKRDPIRTTKTTTEEKSQEMSVKIRLRRMGAKKRPFYRMVVADSRRARDGRFIETLGYYNPCVEPAELKINNDRAAYWLGCGAQPSDTAQALLKKQGVYDKITADKAPAAETLSTEAPVDAPAS